MNTGDTNTRHDADGPQAPARLVAALKEPSSRRVFVPPAMDAAILSAARQQLEKPKRAEFSFRPWFVWPATAAACLALVGMIHFGTQRRESPLAIAREDINGDGRVDILDAFQFARELRDGRQPGADLDLNLDGVVDERDADVIAAHAVKLEKGGRS
ncbi:MAG TPA: dockerin type I domain-containing protein [Verrucomicrobiota bacterium]|nr:dockerin type I domain-containing protein [Verrucomicrobiota bacterium]